MTVGTFKGRITPFNLPEILKFLKESGKTGILRLASGDAAKGLYVRRGRIVAVDSAAPADSLIALVRAAGSVTAEQAAAAEELMPAGVRPGRALVDIGALSPVDLWQWSERRVQEVTRGVLLWDSGSFEFEEGAVPPEDWMIVELDILDVLLSALRDLEKEKLLAARLPEPHAVFEHVTFSEGGEAPSLLPHEKYVMGLVNGRRTTDEIARISELGDSHTRMILALLLLVGCARHRRSETVDTGPLPAEDSSLDVRAIIRAYNDMYSFLYQYMIKEVGPIAEHVIEKYLREVRDAHQALFNKVTLGKDGTLNEEVLSRNVRLLRAKNRQEILVSGMNEFLYSGLLAVKRTLGAEHEEIVVRRLKDHRKSPALLG